MWLDEGSDFLHANVADASPTSPMHRRYIGDVLEMRRDPLAPSTRAPSRRPLDERERVSVVFLEFCGTAGFASFLGEASFLT
eukprot:9483562-Pyramimonas_sp.AAC.1